MPTYESTARAQEHSATLRKPAVVGAGLADSTSRGARYDARNVVQPDTAAAPSTWQSTLKYTHSRSREQDRSEFSSSYRHKAPPLGSDAASLAACRQRWERESAASAKTRFTSEAAQALGKAVPSRFRVCPTRAVPGAPPAIDRLRKEALARWGPGAIAQARRVLRMMDSAGAGALSHEELAWAVSDLGVALSPGELEQLAKWFDPEASGSLSVDDIVAGIRCA